MVLRSEQLESLLIEWHFRRGEGEDPSVEELCGDAPELCAELQMEIDRQQRFLDAYAPAELTRLVRSIQSGPTAQLINSNNQFLGNRFRLLSQLGQGSTGAVFRAYDFERKRYVALKQPRFVHPVAIYRLKREFRSLADLVHRNLVKPYELFEVDGSCFYTMELVEGRNFLNYVRLPQPNAEVLTTTQLNLDRLRSVLAQLVQGVVALHDAEKLHLDIKPSNVLVTQEGRVVLIDFGLARNVERPKLEYRTETAIAGTIGYLSPEQGAGRPLTKASDWYSVGAMLYEALTGRLPFQVNPNEVLSQKQMLKPPPPVEISADVPEDLNALCVALLQLRAEDRPTEKEILHQVCLPNCDVPSEVSVAVRKPLEDVPLLGRVSELATLNAAFDASLKGVPAVVRVWGRSGVGKTALIRQFLAGLMDRGEAVVLAGRCYERESMPFPAMDSLIDALSRYLGQLPELETKALLPRGVSALTRLFPALSRIGAVANGPIQRFETSNEQELRQRGFNALRELLARLSDRQPLVLFVDDLQWGDVDSAVLLADLVSPPDPAPLLLIVSYRSEDANSPCLQTLTGALESRDVVVESAELHVEPLHSDLANELALTLLQSVRAPTGKSTTNVKETAAAIARESAGTPWLIELACSLIDDAQSDTSNGGLCLDDIFWQRVAKLPEATRNLLEVISVAGRPLFQADAFQAAGLGTEGQDALEQLRSVRSRLLRTTGVNRDKLDTYHDRVRETVLRNLPAEKRKEYHRRIASVLEFSSQADPEALATHWQGAGEPVRAGGHAARAAARAEDALAFDQAATLYQFAIKLLPPNVVAEHDLGTKLARALGNAGRGVEAADAYRAASVGMSRREQIDRQSCAAAQLIRSGHIDHGLVVLRRVLSDIGFKLAKTPGRALWLAIIYRIRLRLRGLHFREVAEREIHPDELRRIDICWSVSTALGMIDNIRGADFSACNLLLALRAGEPYRIARALTIEVAYSAGTSWGRDQAARLLETAEALARRLDHSHALGMVTMAKGVSRFLAGDWPSAREFCDLAEDTFRDHCTGVAWELDTTRTISLWSLFFMGDIARLKSRLPNLIREANERGNLYASTNFATLAGHLLWLADDDPIGARRELNAVVGKWSQEGYHIQHVTSEIARTQIDLYEGQALTARKRLIACWPALKGSLLLHGLEVVRIVMIALRARTTLAVASRDAEPEHLLREAERDARLLERAKAPWSKALAKVIRASIAANRGDNRLAATLLDAAATACDSVNMRLFATATRRQLGGLIGNHQGRTLVAAADDFMKEQGIQDSVRMTNMLVPGFSKSPNQ
jgi:eukaryotic-like serine/threonine-protein kinase